MNKNKKDFIPVMLTPFNDDGSIDFGMLTILIEDYIEKGVGGLFANCLSSEMFDLLPEERLALTQHVVKVVNGRVPVVATATFGGGVLEQADFVKRMYDTGITATIVISNMLAEESEASKIFEERFFQLLEYTERIPMGLYECPDPFKRIVSADQLSRFVDTGRVIYHKDTCLDIAMVRDKIEKTKHEDAFGLYDAYMVHAVESLTAGSAGLSCIQGNYFPDLVVWLCDNYYRIDKKKEVKAVQDFFTKNMHLMHDGYPKVAKFMVKHRIPDFPTKVRRGDFGLTIELRDSLNKLWVEYTELMTNIA
ncbi:dihydrodipicolinate synthase family protein [Sphingobacterium sp. UT-1RO-CII-1]|uniref:dihydrodipicolinate synthase family protein n=1 Tax=Sphingobacterium sp. UT-1RO-CII-1 TaxID=2995225 RepID=UPI00227D2857|nr:dihydrodipicolinate synthase family protein [Sphingobacterium sp. UT-1RO-CII-1]MCY4779427.1 dihydrodipicolinate synthase family protein [Sphingobacterium sp. UT-1RO-CII-1]